MNKAIVMSTQPNWVAKILNGEKKVEVRKTKPKCELPIDVYLYCTQGKPYLTQQSNHQFTIRDTKDYTNLVNGKVVAKFTLNKIEDCCDMSLPELENKSQLSIEQILSYIKAKEVDTKMIYAWHIDNLVIFDKPMELWEFYKSRFEPNKITDAYEKTFNDLSKYRVTKAPQSWQYVYVKGDKYEV